MTGWQATPKVEIGELAVLSAVLNPWRLFKVNDVWMFPMDQRLIMSMKKMKCRIFTDSVLVNVSTCRGKQASVEKTEFQSDS